MPKIDAYLRSIERFGASGALLASGQSITLRFPTGDRHATQVTPHELLVAMIREVAPAAAWGSLDAGKPASFELDSGGNRFSIAATPHPGAWQVAIEVLPASGAGEEASASAGASSTSATRGEPAGRGGRGRGGERGERGAELDRMGERVDELAASLAIERTPYDDAPGGVTAAAGAGSGSLLIDQLLGWARGRKASDLVLAAGAPAQARIDGRWVIAEDQAPIDGELLARELGVLAPAAARTAWLERGEACFGADEAGGRLRVQLGRDIAGPRAALRLLLGEAPTAERLGVPEAARRWLRARRGLIALAGAPGSGKSTTLAALVREQAAAGAAVICIEEPIELRHRGSALISQREVGAHVASVAAGVRAALREGADVIAVGRCAEPAAAEAMVEAVAAGALVLAALDAAGAAAALVRLAEHGGAAARHVLAEGVLGALGQQLCERADGGGRMAAFEVLPGGHELATMMRDRRWEQLPEIFSQQRAAGALSQRDAIAELTRRGYLTAPA